MLLFWTTNAVVTSRATSNWALSESHVVNIVAVYMMMSIDRLCPNNALFSSFFSTNGVPNKKRNLLKCPHNAKGPAVQPVI